MLSNLEIILPVFLLIGLGYLSALRGLFSSDNCDVVMKFAQTFAIPALLFTAVAKLDLATVFQPELLLSYYTGAASVFILGILIARIVFKRRPGEAVAIGFTSMFSNTVLLGLPIIERAFGEDALQPVYAIIAIHAPFCYITGITTMELARAGGQPLGKTLKRIAHEVLTNALTIGIILGFVVNLSGLQLPTFVWSPIEMLVTAALPAALFALGGILVRYKLADRFGETVVVLILRLFLHPAIAYTLSHIIFAMPIEFVRAAVLVSAMAPGVNVYIFANMYDRAKGTAANSVIIGTATAILSISFWLFILGT